MAKRISKLETVHFCFDRILPKEKVVEAMDLATRENKKNTPSVPKLPGVSLNPVKIAVLRGKTWSRGRTLKICFLDGSKTQQERTIDHATGWLKCNIDIKLDFTASHDESDIRISFQADPGSWSWIGTDNISIAKSEPTMNFGWLKDDTEDREYNRVVLHEFGHALGCIHEHQSPDGGIQWNKKAVYKFFGGPPNFWSREETYENVIGKYSMDQLNSTKFDPESIMLYAFPAGLIRSGTATHENDTLSKKDCEFIHTIYS